MQARMLIFGMQGDDDLLYRGIENQPSSAYSSLYLSNFLSFHTLMQFYVKDFSTTMQGRMLIFVMQVDDDLLYRGIENQSSSYSSLFCPIFFPSILWRMTFFVKDFSRTMQARMLIFGMHVDDDLLYRGFGSQPSPAYSSLYLSIFFPSILSRMKIFVKDFSRTLQARVLIFSMQVDDDLLYRGIKNWSSPAYSSLYLSNFLSVCISKNEIFRQRFLKNHTR